MPVGERGGVGGSGREVVFFTGIVAETEELLGAVGGAPEVFVATVGEGGEGLGGARRSTGSRLAEHQLADDDRGDHSGEVGEEAGGDSVARTADGDGAEIDGEDVEGRFAAAENGTRHARGEGVGAEALGHFSEERGGGAATERAHEDDG